MMHNEYSNSNRVTEESEVCRSLYTFFKYGNIGIKNRKSIHLSNTFIDQCYREIIFKILLRRT